MSEFKVEGFGDAQDSLKQIPALIQGAVDDALPEIGELMKKTAERITIQEIGEFSGDYKTSFEFTIENMEVRLVNNAVNKDWSPQFYYANIIEFGSHGRYWVPFYSRGKRTAIATYMIGKGWNPDAARNQKSAGDDLWLTNPSTLKAQKGMWVKQKPHHIMRRAEQQSRPKIMKLIVEKLENKLKEAFG